ncbi:hypothetical protein OIU85_003040 [Salix viminalis]|uniref:Uncharacterized protein n=1 Tax=Salix viminalis TaxID=40686 RepID=A0A9Q0T0M1_SALVM|nr:hypothetical protein OIU85_003040 [Salix viminalis]
MDNHFYLSITKQLFFCHVRNCEKKQFVSCDTCNGSTIIIVIILPALSLFLSRCLDECCPSSPTLEEKQVDRRCLQYLRLNLVFFIQQTVCLLPKQVPTPASSSLNMIRGMEKKPLMSSRGSLIDIKIQSHPPSHNCTKIIPVAFACANHQPQLIPG